MGIRAASTLVLVAVLAGLCTVGNAVDNVKMYNGSKITVQDAEQANLTSKSALKKYRSDVTNEALTKALVEDTVLSTGSTIEKVSLLSLQNSNKVLSTGSSFSEVVDGDFYRVEIQASDISVLLKSFDEKKIPVDAHIIPISNKVIFDIYLGGDTNG